MKNLLFLDVETTGLNAEDRICSIAAKSTRKNIIPMDFLIKPPLPVKLLASQTNHITNKMVENAPTFSESKMDMLLPGFYEDIMIAHNAKFDIGMLEKEGIKFPNYICTFKVAMYLDPAGDRFERHNLSYLRYYYDVDVKADAHTAMGDVIVLEHIFNKMVVEMLNGDQYDDVVLEKMIEISSKPAIIPRFTFGKYGPKEGVREKGLLIKDVAHSDSGYLQWLKKEKMKEDVLDADWIYTIDQALASR